MAFIIYGATGYTGKLTVKHAIQLGLRPTIAGRDEEKVSLLAKELGLDFRIFDLENIDNIAKIISEFQVVLHCAGPFSKTAKPMVEACLKSGVHYLDITGEIAILEWVKQFDAEAKKKNIVLMCGVGFDLVPTDCVALKLHNELPDASHLEIAFTMEGGSISHGTLTTMGINLGNPSAARINGKINEEPLGKAGKWIDFGKNKKFCISIPWGDLSSAYNTTHIPNIRTYSSASKFTFYVLKIQFLLNPILRSGWFKRLFQGYVDRNITGPSEIQNTTGRSYVHGRVWNSQGEEKETLLECPESYQLTAQTSILVVQKLLNGSFVGGYYTPAGLFGENLILEIEGCKYLK